MVNPGTYNLSTHLTAHASTMREGIESLHRFYRLLTDRPFWHFVEDDRTGTIVFDAGTWRLARAPLPVRAHDLQLLQDVDGLRARVAREDGGLRLPRSRLPRRVHAGLPWHGALRSGVHRHRLRPQAPRRRANPPRPRAARDDCVARREARLQMPGATYTERVRRHVLDGKPQTRHDMPSVARALGMSARLLRRRLEEEGSSFREVADAALGALAEASRHGGRATDRGRGLRDGFLSHPSAFHRAFKRWTGATPAEVRDARSARSATKQRNGTAKQRNATARYSDSASGSERGP